MANNYLQTSEAYDLSPEQVAWFEKFMEDCARVEEADPEDPEDAAFLARMATLLGVDQGDSMEDAVSQTAAFTVEKESDGATSLWVHDDGGEYVNLDLVISVLVGMLQETQDDRVLTGTWAATCSKPRIGEFGGGWFAVSATERRYGNSWDAAQDAAKEMRPKKVKKAAPKRQRKGR